MGHQRHRRRPGPKATLRITITLRVKVTGVVVVIAGLALYRFAAVHQF
ncbi:hypothetical protein [Amycolatopsis pithecellobii]|uniref:Uncharacterized protein n=1 Tax=Amycolatopsis pithecellobii TaxID=664692 RepID=A0A6N7YX97_9PSEU|nr:hypothetical protein [Amycolatopsis pithecellobii]MTD57695.1 hypothetical protein [Amycolatopsis pithecellobii]